MAAFVGSCFLLLTYYMVIKKKYEGPQMEARCGDETSNDIGSNVIKKYFSERRSCEEYVREGKSKRHRNLISHDVIKSPK